MTGLIDSHCHLDLEAFDADRDQVVARARQAGVTALVVPAVNCTQWAALEALAGPGVGVALGLHPCFDHQPGDLEALAERLERPHALVAIGECGLDAVAGRAPMAEQLACCQAQLTLACQHKLPVILHVRKAHNELLGLLAHMTLPAGGVVHGFSGSLDLARQYLRHGLCLGVGGVITYERANKTRHTLAQVPIDALVLETDSPDMPLQGHQGQRNEPARLPQVLATLAELRGANPQALATQLTRNTQRLFPRLSV
ncbi:TatD family hydrolase [Ferrimonas balearica]|uniref:TatD family hydrolase n=1 Tax=Ferrimonas balearica TaxID=44012 RepID=UPI001C993812|nr:TatD family hydrolase [Ferrimonas balearica]MBY5992715.1 TatD family hydrolase [Ferrimonas balearica]